MSDERPIELCCDRCMELGESAPVGLQQTSKMSPLCWRSPAVTLESRAYSNEGVLVAAGCEAMWSMFSSSSANQRLLPLTYCRQVMVEVGSSIVWREPWW